MTCDHGLAVRTSTGESLGGWADTLAVRGDVVPAYLGRHNRPPPAGEAADAYEGDLLGEFLGGFGVQVSEGVAARVCVANGGTRSDFFSGVRR